MKQERIPGFRAKLREMQGDDSNTDFAKKLELTRQTYGFYLNGDRIPDAEKLKQIAEHCHVSADWLLGLSGSKTPKADLRAVCDYTGLSEDAIEAVRQLSREAKHAQPGRDLAQRKLAILDALLTDMGIGVHLHEMLDIMQAYLENKCRSAEPQVEEVEPLTYEEQQKAERFYLTEFHQKLFNVDEMNNYRVQREFPNILQEFLDLIAAKQNETKKSTEGS